jgi:hypothetical protein
MDLLQELVTRVLPGTWTESIEAESISWRPFRISAEPSSQGRPGPEWLGSWVT